MGSHVGDLLQSRPSSELGSSVGQVAIRTHEKSPVPFDTGLEIDGTVSESVASQGTGIQVMLLGPRLLGPRRQ
jgi:hypothetical protein